MDSQDGEQVTAPPERLEVPLSGGGVPVLMPLFLGLYGGIALRATLSGQYHLGDAAVAAICFAVSVSITLLAVAIKRRQLPDRIRVTSDSVEFARGERAVSRVRLTRLAEINEIDVPNGKVLVLSDDRQTLAVIAAHLADPRQYADVTRAITEAVGRADPSGGIARMAVQAARLREVVARRPMRATYILAAVLAVAFFMAARALRILRGEPFPLEDLGAVSGPLVRSETWRLISYAFVDSSETRFLFSVMSLLWIGGALEKLVGWERMMFSFLAGVVGGGIAYVMTGAVLPATGLQGGVFGLIGLLAATQLRTRRLQTIRPQGFAWFVAGWYALFMSARSLLLLFYGFEAWKPPMALLAGGLALGFTVGLATIAGVDVPVSNASRREWRGFGIVSAVCLVVGLIGGVTHNKRHVTHGADNELLTQALVRLPPTDENADVQNRIAYTWLQKSDVSHASLEIALRLAGAAVDASDDGQYLSTLDTLAVAQYKLGNADAAQSLLEEAVGWGEGLKVSDEQMAHLKERALKIVRRHLEDVQRGFQLSPDPDETDDSLWPLGLVGSSDDE